MEPLPQTIGRYVVEALVGSGAMGRIFRAHDPDIRRTVAIKLISTRLMSSADRDFYIRRFRREAEAAARCGPSTTSPCTTASPSWRWSSSPASACAKRSTSGR